MARKIEDIKKEMTNNFINNDEIKRIYNITAGKSFEDEFSVVSLESILFYIVAFSMWTLEKLFDIHVSEVDDKLAVLKPHSLKWYRNKAKAFQLGFSLLTDSDVFDNANASFEQIENSKIIKYAAVTEATTESRLIVKIATEIDEKLQPITDEQKEAFDAYIGEIKDAGVAITVINYLPDQLRLAMTIYYDPLVIDSTGNGILTGGRPVEDAIQQYLKELPFNGELVLAHLVDKLQLVKGVVIPHVVAADSRWIENNAYNNFSPIDVRKVPESGYFEITDFSLITYKANV